MQYYFLVIYCLCIPYLQVENLYRCLEREFKKNGKQPVNLFEFAFNPRSFAQTIENLFHLSFLVKDGRAGLVGGESGSESTNGGPADDSSVNGDGLMRVAWYPPPERGAQQQRQPNGEEEQRSALAFTTDMGIWRGICERYHLQKCLVPDRGYHDSDNEQESESESEEEEEREVPPGEGGEEEEEEGGEEENEEGGQEDEEEAGSGERSESVGRNPARVSGNGLSMVKSEPMSQ